MPANRQRGAVSLGWSMLLFFAIVAAVMTALLSFGLERNLFAEGWDHAVGKMQRSAVLQAPKQAASGKVVQADSPAIRKCVQDGKVMYSNVGCDSKASSKQAVK